MNKDLISIIIPIYNVEQYLKECVDSVLNQTYSNLEIILVDDGSPDRCPEMCDEYARNDLRVQVIHKENGGLSAARNAGLDVAKGEYISFVDSDDYISEDMIQALYDRAVQTQADLTFCSIERVDEKGHYISLEKVESAIYDRNNFWENKYYNQPSASTVAWNKLYKKHIFDELRYAVGRIHEDDIILLNIINKCNIIATVQRGKYMYRQRDDSIIHTKYTLANFQVIEERFDRIEYFLKNNSIETAKRALYHAFGVITIGYAELDFAQRSIKEEYKTQVNRFKVELKKVGRNNFSFLENMFFSIRLALPANTQIRKIIFCLRIWNKQW